MSHTQADAVPAPAYRAYLLRLWREAADASWRCSLQAAESAERLGFADLEQLVAYLLRLTDSAELEAAARSPPDSGALS
jgi:hypothetical protein